MALEIVQILAAGTFGTVAVVRNTASGRLHAAKVLKAEHLGNDKLIRRIRDEAQLLMRLDHPNIVRVDEIREFGGRPILLLEWVRGAPLDALLHRMPEGLPPADALELIRLTTAALGSAWSSADPLTGLPMRVIHRDFKPSNVLLSVDGVVKVLDFGIAKSTFEGRESETITVVLGAHGYLAPERLDGAEDSVAGDIYALGCSLFELLTGRRMKLSLHREIHGERMEKELMRMRPAGTNARTLSGLTELIAAMCAYDPSHRPDHAAVIDSLIRLMMFSGWVPDLPRLALKHVTPILDGQSFSSVLTHPAYKDLQFLEAPTGETPVMAAPREIDETIRAFLAREGWHHHLESLRRLLASDPSWTAAPFLELLDGLSSGRFFRRWKTDEDSRDQMVAVLEVLKARSGPSVTARVKALTRHSDPEVSTLARALVSGGGSG
jgi:serine/threonine protein kinase